MKTKPGSLNRAKCKVACLIRLSLPICVHLCHLVRQESFADLVSCKELAMGIARSP
jgi:hypothetical protein